MMWLPSGENYVTERRWDRQID